MKCFEHQNAGKITTLTPKYNLKDYPHKSTRNPHKLDTRKEKNLKYIKIWVCQSYYIHSPMQLEFITTNQVTKITCNKIVK